MILEIDNVELNFAKKTVLGGIYLKAETGKITGILGKNGCGKSILLQIIFGSLKPKYGLIRINGKNITKPLFKTGKIGYLPQEGFLPNNLKISNALNLFGVEWEDFLATFNNLSYLKNVRAKTLSGGEKRLVEIFIILKASYEVVLLDEPFSHLSPIYIESVNSLLQSEKDKKAIVITDHIYEQIINMSDVLYLIKNGSTILMDSEKKLVDYGYLR